MDDPHNLDRFVRAQDSIYSQALGELRRGRKSSHWMWFIFPQIAGLGSSETSRLYAIASADEARAYLAHPSLGARLRECTQAVLDVKNTSAEDIFGGIDAVKLRSSLTLFGAVAAPDDNVFARALDKYFGGRADERTLALMKHSGQSRR